MALVRMKLLNPSPDDYDIDIPALFSSVIGALSTVYSKTAVAHPYITGFLLIMWSYHPRAPFQAMTFVIWTFPKKLFIGILRLLGFRKEGVEPDSYASRYQAIHYQDYIPEDSLFARYQSYGALGDFRETRQEEPEPSAWWGVLGWGLYLAGFGVMLTYGSLKGT